MNEEKDAMVWQLYTEGCSDETIMRETGYLIHWVYLVIKRRTR